MSLFAFVMSNAIKINDQTPTSGVRIWTSSSALNISATNQINHFSIQSVLFANYYF